ncbi:MAG TPA: hypothetical protein VM122_00325 [Usitatibacter sp.]|nr:hypothetical protein [Usitatibacter sp.]
MKLALGIAALVLPVVALAQVSQSRATITGDAAWSPDYRACVERSDSLADRKAFLDREKYDIDDAAAQIARDGERLRVDLARLQATDAAAVAEYNARSAEHNRRVAGHNRRVAEMNSAAAMLNGDSANMMSYCNLRTYRWREN